MNLFKSFKAHAVKIGEQNEELKKENAQMRTEMENLLKHMRKQSSELFELRQKLNIERNLY